MYYLEKKSRIYFVLYHKFKIQHLRNLIHNLRKYILVVEFILGKLFLKWISFIFLNFTSYFRPPILNSAIHLTKNNL